MNLNIPQRIVLVFFAIAILIACIGYVPWNYIHPITGHLIRSGGYTFIGYPKKIYASVPVIDIARIGVEVFGLIVVTGIALLVASDRKGKN